MQVEAVPQLDFNSETTLVLLQLKWCKHTILHLIFHKELSSHYIFIGLDICILSQLKLL